MYSGQVDIKTLLQSLVTQMAVNETNWNSNIKGAELKGKSSAQGGESQGRRVANDKINKMEEEEKGETSGSVKEA